MKSHGEFETVCCVCDCVCDCRLALPQEPDSRELFRACRLCRTGSCSCRRTSSRCKATKATVGIECGLSFLLMIAPLASVQELQLLRNIQELEAFITVLTN